jgi:hypothetical protein
MMNNPPAFPCPEQRGPVGCGIREAADGMTLRDYFAGQYISHDGSSRYSPNEFAKAAYALADAMLAEREK